MIKKIEKKGSKIWAFPVVENLKIDNISVTFMGGVDHSGNYTVFGGIISGGNDERKAVL